ncbi:MAG: DUF4339 domain-containing protein [Thermoguttaceae bacterium]
MADEWYCRISDEESGPISAPELKVMAAKGLLSPQDMVRRGEKGTWVAAARVKGLFSQGEAPAAGTTAGPSPQSTPTQTAPAKPKRILRAKAVADDADASVSAPPAGFPEHSGANDHPSGGPPPLRRKGDAPPPKAPAAAAEASPPVSAGDANFDFLGGDPYAAAPRSTIAAKSTAGKSPARIKLKPGMVWMLVGLASALAILTIVLFVVTQLRGRKSAETPVKTSEPKGSTEDKANENGPQDAKVNEGGETSADGSTKDETMKSPAGDLPSPVTGGKEKRPIPSKKPASKVKQAAETPEPVKAAATATSPPPAAVKPSPPPAPEAAPPPAAAKEKPAVKEKELTPAEVLGLDTKDQKNKVKAPWDEIQTDSKK